MTRNNRNKHLDIYFNKLKNLCFPFLEDQEVA